jgi:hypothetical protein
MLAWECLRFLEIRLSQVLDDVDVLDSADAQCLHIYVIQRIAAVDATAALVTGFVMLEATAAVGVASRSTVAVIFFFHTPTPL